MIDILETDALAVDIFVPINVPTLTFLKDALYTDIFALDPIYRFVLIDILETDALSVDIFVPINVPTLTFVKDAFLPDTLEFNIIELLFPMVMVLEFTVPIFNVLIEASILVV